MNGNEIGPSLGPEVVVLGPSLDPVGPPATPAAENAPLVTEQADQAMPTLPATEPGSPTSRWEKDRRVTALWSVDQERNTWVGIGGVGWRRLDGGSESALVALTMLAAHAREQGARVSYREQDGVIHELYVW